MSAIFRIVIASLRTYTSHEVSKPKRGRPTKKIYDVDQTKQEVIYDQKLDDGMRGATGDGKRERRANRKN